MADSISPERRSWNMSRIRGSDTKIEVKVRKYLFSLGFRYRKNDKRLPGKPDIVLPKYHCVIFIHGCFWHRHEGCQNATFPKSHQDFWQEKFEKNVKNDQKHRMELEKSGWKVIVLWECEINKEFEKCMARTISSIIKNVEPELFESFM